MRRVRATVVLVALVGAALLVARSNSGDAIGDHAHKLHFSSIVLDTHDDTTQRFFTKDFDLGK
ncbi:MAG TPA: hypothetical protein VJR23_12195, partial [Candidatus Acidoferrales bacterium]|nr:hypothetical protein [Candidatus Acidoferrales bacterium]